MKRKDFEDLLKPYFLVETIQLIMAAYEFSKYGHRNQERDDGSRYFDHPRSVAIVILTELGIKDSKIIIAALLHDIIEDSYILTEPIISKLFGEDVALWVKYLTKEPDVNYLSRLIHCPVWQIILLKLCDRIHNLRELGNCTPEKIKKQVTETRKDYLPLCTKLGNMLPDDLKHLQHYFEGEISKLCDKHSS